MASTATALPAAPLETCAALATSIVSFAPTSRDRLISRIDWMTPHPGHRTRFGGAMVPLATDRCTCGSLTYASSDLVNTACLDGPPVSGMLAYEAGIARPMTTMLKGV